MAKRSRPLPDDEFRELSRKWRASKGNDRDILKKMVEPNLGLANAIAFQYRHWGVPIEDLFHESVLGLIRACEKFDPRLKNRISTYASWWCRAFVFKAIMKRKSSLRGVDGKVARKVALLMRRATRHLSSTEIAEELGRSVEDVERAMANQQEHSSLESVMRWSDGEERNILIEDLFGRYAPGPDELVEQKLTMLSAKTRVSAALAKLAPRDALIMRRRYMAPDEDDNATLQEIGDELGLTRERVRQLEERAKARLRKLLAA